MAHFFQLSKSSGHYLLLYFKGRIFHLLNQMCRNLFDWRIIESTESLLLAHPV